MKSTCFGLCLHKTSLFFLFSAAFPMTFYAISFFIFLPCFEDSLSLYRLSLLIFSTILQHGFCKYPITTRRILHKYMRDSSCKFLVLYHRTSTHSLYNSSCFVNQFLICNMDDKTFICIFMIQIDLYNFQRTGQKRCKTRRLYCGI